MLKLARTTINARPVTLFVRPHSVKLGMEHVPSPPKLPKEDQEEFERLQKVAASQMAIDEYNENLKVEKAKEPVIASTPVVGGTDIGSFAVLKTIPEFEGEVNPKTGEVGGPKQDPLRHGDWAFNGRVTDF